MAVSILYVEDDPLTRQAIAGRLRRRGYEVIEATSGEEAMGLVEQLPQPAAVLLDVELPGIDGVETYRRLRVKFPQMPAVFCSATLSHDGHGPFAALGVPESALLAKPCEFNRLLAAIENAVQHEH